MELPLRAVVLAAQPEASQTQPETMVGLAAEGQATRRVVSQHNPGGLPLLRGRVTLAVLATLTRVATQTAAVVVEPTRQAQPQELILPVLAVRVRLLALLVRACTGAAAVVVVMTIVLAVVAGALVA